MYAVGVAFHQLAAILCEDTELIIVELRKLWQLCLPNAAVVHQGHGRGLRIPAVEVAHNADARGMRRPSAKYHFPTVYSMRAEVFICAGVTALVE